MEVRNTLTVVGTLLLLVSHISHLYAYDDEWRRHPVGVPEPFKMVAALMALIIGLAMLVTSLFA